MPIRPELLVRGLDGRPQPPPDLVARIQRYDKRLGLFYTNAAWAITEAWREDDPRRAWIQDGSVQPVMAFDICGYLPMTCSIDEAPAYIERMLKSYTPEEYTRLRDALRHWNLGDGEGADALHEETVLVGVDDALTKDGPSVGVFNVPTQLTQPTEPSGSALKATANPAIGEAMPSVRLRRHRRRHRGRASGNGDDGSTGDTAA